jgi:transcription antitermination factor NusG
MNSLPWYALQVRPRFEKAIASTLLFKGYEGFLPLYTQRSRWSDRIKEVQLPLFSGYLFCRFDVNKRLPILVTPGVLRVVGIGRTPYPVDEREIQALQAIILSDLEAQPWSYLNVGQEVRIELGVLAGVEGILIGVKGSSKLVVSVSLLKRSVAVEIDESWVAPRGRTHAHSPVAVNSILKPTLLPG